MIYLCQVRNGVTTKNYENQYQYCQYYICWGLAKMRIFSFHFYTIWPPYRPTYSESFYSPASLQDHALVQILIYCMALQLLRWACNSNVHIGGLPFYYIKCPLLALFWDFPKNGPERRIYLKHLQRSDPNFKTRWAQKRACSFQMSGHSSVYFTLSWSKLFPQIDAPFFLGRRKYDISYYKRF